MAGSQAATAADPMEQGDSAVSSSSGLGRGDWESHVFSITVEIGVVLRIIEKKSTYLDHACFLKRRRVQPFRPQNRILGSYSLRESEGMNPSQRPIGS